jgi:hypothetical protein
VPVAPAPSVFPGMDDEGQRKFSFFLENTATNLGGYFEDPAWSHFVVQLAASEASIRHVSIAFGALHEHVTGQNGPKDPTISSTVRTYGEAVKHLRRHMEDCGWEKLEVTLTACLLCVGFEWLRQDTQSAAIHLRGGVGLLQQWISQSLSRDDLSMPGAPSFEGPTGMFIRHHLAPFYSRLALQAGSLMNFSFPWQFLPPERTQLALFESLEHARDSLVNIIGQVHFPADTRELLRTKSYEAECQHQRFAMMLQRWASYFEAYTAKNVVNKRREQTAGAIKMLYLTATVILPNIGFDAIHQASDFVEEFGGITEMAEKLLLNDPCFTIDLGLVAPLYYVATYCLHASIQGRALQLLRANPMHEGYWNSADALEKVAIRRAEWISANSGDGEVQGMMSAGTNIQLRKK